MENNNSSVYKINNLDDIGENKNLVRSHYRYLASHRTLYDIEL